MKGFVADIEELTGEISDFRHVSYTAGASRWYGSKNQG